MEGTLADGPYGSAQSRGVDDRCGGFIDTPVAYLQETMRIHGGVWKM